MEDQQRTVVNNATQKIKELAPERLTMFMRVLNMVNAVLLIVSGVVTFTMIDQCPENKDCGTSSMVVLAFYTILFAVLLLVFEIRVNSAKGWITKNCGFMYSNRGKATLLLFLATMCFSVINSNYGGLWWFSVLVAIFTTLNGVFVCVTICLHPSFDAYSSAHAKEEMEGLPRHSFTTAQSNPQPNNHNSATSDYTFGDAHSGGGGGSYNAYSYDESHPQPSYGASSSPFSSQPPPPPPPSNENPFANDNPFSNI